jgi:hypothetical protein
MAFRVPKRHHTGLAKFLNLGDEPFESLISTLEDLPFTLQFMEPLRRAIKSLDGIPPGDASTIADALVSLFAAWSSSDRARADFVADVVTNITESSSDEFAELRQSKDSMQTRLTRLFDTPSLTRAVKAEGFIFEFDNVFSSVRVLTDVRPIFDEDRETAEPQALMVVHNLRVHYHRGDKHEDFFVSLDSKDLKKFVEVVGRAQSRAEALKKTIATLNIPFIEPE